MSSVLEFIVRHGEAVLFVYVFIDQVGVPIPAVPVLLAAGALAATGKLSLSVAIGVGAMASLAADLIWYSLGRLRGATVLRTLCKVTLEPDSCVRRTQDLFVRHGIRSLLIAKFIPGLSTIAPPLAGVVGVGLLKFSLYSAVGALLWVGAWMAIGLAVGDALEDVAAMSRHGASIGGAALAAVILGYVIYKWIDRRRFLRGLRTARIGADDLMQLLEASQKPFVVDLRSPVDIRTSPYTIPGALRIEPEELERRRSELPRDREIVLYCT